MGKIEEDWGCFLLKTFQPNNFSQSMSLLFVILITYVIQTFLNSGYQSQAPHNDFFHFAELNLGGRQSNVTMTNSIAAK